MCMMAACSGSFSISISPTNSQPTGSEPYADGSQAGGGDTTSIAMRIALVVAVLGAVAAALGVVANCLGLFSFRFRS